MTTHLGETRHAVADRHYEAYDFEPYRVESADGWTWLDGRGPAKFTRVVYVVPPREDGTPGDPDEDASFAATLSVRFEGDSAVPVSVTATLNGEDIGTPGTVACPDLPACATQVPSVTPETALKAILARLDGRFDDPALMSFGPLHTDSSADIARFARAGLGEALAA